MMTPFEQNSFTSYEGARQAGRALGELLSGAPSAQEEKRRADSVVLLRTLHPDYEQILADPAFRRWVNDSPARQELLSKAHTQFDVSAANTLFGAWKQLRITQ